MAPVSQQAFWVLSGSCRKRKALKATTVLRWSQERSCPLPLPLAGPGACERLEEARSMEYCVPVAKALQWHRSGGPVPQPGAFAQPTSHIPVSTLYQTAYVAPRMLGCSADQLTQPQQNHRGGCSEEGPSHQYATFQTGVWVSFLPVRLFL